MSLKSQMELTTHDPLGAFYLVSCVLSTAGHQSWRLELELELETNNTIRGIF
jgi:hypothetical protein